MDVVADHIPELEETERRIRERLAREGPNDDFSMVVRLKESGELVGMMGLHPRDWLVPRFEIGYWCRTKYVGHGYVTEAARALTAAAFDRLKAERVEIRCDPENRRSRAVAERIGYRVEACFRRYEIGPAGKLRDTLVLALTSVDWERASCVRAPSTFSTC